MECPHQLVHVAHIPVRWGDMDAFGHVNNTVYFRFAEQARIEWLHSLGIDEEINQEQSVVIVNASCTFLKPITYPATVEVRTKISKPGRSSMQTHFEIRCLGDDDTLCAEGASKMVWWSPRTGKSLPLPARLRDSYTQ